MTDTPGLLVVDKPAGLTSHDVVARVRRLAGTRRVGHAGTLDPMATGVLILGINRATKLLQFVVGTGKEYRATVRLGAATTTDDAEGEVTESPGCPPLSVAAVDDALTPLRGDIMQVPSSVSAIKVNGERAYKRVRQGEEIQLAARPVTVSRLEVLGEPRSVEDFVDVDILVQCSSGTYIRALARDLGRSLGGGGHLTALRRTQVGPWRIEEATELPDLQPKGFDEVCPMLFPVAQVSAAAAAKFRHGQAPSLAEVTLPEGLVDGGLVTLAVNETGVIGLARVIGGKLKTEFVVDPA